MPTAPSQSKSVIDILSQGQVASGGSNARVWDWHFYFYRATATNPFNKTAIESAFQAAIMVPIMALLNHRATQTANLVRDITDATDPYLSLSRAVVGSITGDSMSLKLASFTLIEAGLRGKSFRGGKHLFPLSESDTTSGSDDILNAGALARYTTLNTSWLAGFSDGLGNTWLPCIVSRKLSQYRTNPTAVVYNQVTVISTRQSIGSMKKRRVVSVY